MVKTKRAGLKKTTKKSKIVTNKTQKSGKSKKNTDVVEEEVVLNVNAPKIEPVEKVNTNMEVLELENKETNKVNKKRVTKNKKGSRSSKKTKQPAVVEETPADVEVEEPSAAVVEEPAVVKVEEPAAVVEEPAAVVDVKENEKEEIVETDINLLGKNLLNLTSTLTELLKQVKNVQNDMKVIQKQYNKVSKEHEKMLKKKINSKNNKPSGFAIPSSLSDEMLDFLGLEKGIKVPRNEVLKLINKYIVENELRQEEDKRNILPDKKLKKLLNVKKNDKVTYFNLQSYLKPHFIKT